MTQKIPVNVLNIEATRAHLHKMLTLFRSGGHEPLVFGENNRPEAVVIPFEDYLRLARYDAAHENSFQAVISQRTSSFDDSAAQFDSVEDLAASLGPTGRKWLAAQSVETDERDHE